MLDDINITAQQLEKINESNIKFVTGLKACKEADEVEAYMRNEFSNWIATIYQTIGDDDDIPKFDIQLTLGEPGELEIIPENEAAARIMSIVEASTGASNPLFDIIKDGIGDSLRKPGS